MALASWWRSDTLPDLPARDGFDVRPAEDDAALARLNGIAPEEVRARRAAGHRPYLGSLDGVPVAYGWVATRAASIGELDLSLTLTAADRYLWDFATLPAWQGQGLYPRLLQAILRRQPREVERFWIIAAPENQPSSTGIRKAGFTTIGDLSFDHARRVRLAPHGSRERASVAAALLGIPLVEDQLAPCWRCNSPQAGRATAGACWPSIRREAMPCTCK